MSAATHQSAKTRRSREFVEYIVLRKTSKVDCGLMSIVELVFNKHGLR